MKEYIQKLWEKPHLSDIVYFLEIFQYQKEGIEQKHFRYFLMESPNLEFTREMDDFYNRNKILFIMSAPLRKNLRTHEDVVKRLTKFEKIEDGVEKEKQIKDFILSLWRTGNIKTVGDLDQYLRRLCQNGVIEKSNRKKPYHYNTTVEYEKNYQEMRILEYIERWDIKDKTIIAQKKIGEHRYDVFIFGASEKEFNEKDTKKMTEYLKVICNNLVKILELKKQKTLHNIDGMDEAMRTKLTSIDFFFHGSLI
ncbi:MAG: hypothetical protein JSW60_09375 [Thermoplasmatales archaeon]|nr:MAG: hypothetical protein JSW60_09375 [Thermoplasmatales archaeon]